MKCSFFGEMSTSSSNDQTLAETDEEEEEEEEISEKFLRVMFFNKMLFILTWLVDISDIVIPL